MLLDQGLLLKPLRIQSNGNTVRLPTRRRVEMGLPTEEAEFEEGFLPVRSYKDVVQVPAALRASLPSSFDVVGDIAVIKIPEAMRSHRETIGRAIIEWNPKIRVVLADSGVQGELRIRKIERIAGERRTTTIHVEHGLHYHADLAQVYFSPRLASERKRIADLIKEGETIADPFAGVGPYSILIAKRRRPREVYASDANPIAVKLLRENVATNRTDHVTVLEGEVRSILRGLPPLDRVILDLPHSAMDYLPESLRALGDHGTVHLYAIHERADERNRLEAIDSTVRATGFRVTHLSVHHVRAYSPTKYHTAFDVTVARA
jgi:tRNA (guanine37-N1)-methyltransferase